jgi:hypothetical protein
MQTLSLTVEILFLAAFAINIVHRWRQNGPLFYAPMSVFNIVIGLIVVSLPAMYLAGWLPKGLSMGFINSYMLFLCIYSILQRQKINRSRTGSASN